MDVEEIKRAVSKIEQKIAHLTMERQKFVEFKQNIDCELVDKDKRDEYGLRIPEHAYHEWRTKKVREKFSIERNLTRLKSEIHLLNLERTSLHETWKEARSKEQIPPPRTRSYEAVLLQKEIDELRNQNLQISRQLDAAIREINNIPKSVRGL